MIFTVPSLKGVTTPVVSLTMAFVSSLLEYFTVNEAGVVVTAGEFTAFPTLPSRLEFANANVAVAGETVSV